MKKKILLPFVLLAAAVFAAGSFAEGAVAGIRQVPNIPENPESDFDYELLEDDTVRLSLKSNVKKAQVRFPKEYQGFPVSQAIADVELYRVFSGKYDYYVRTLIIPEGVVFARVNGRYSIELENWYYDDYPKLDLYLPDSLEAVEGLNGFTLEEFPISPDHKIEFKHHIYAAHIKNITFPKDYGYKKLLQPTWRYEYDLFNPLGALLIDNISWEEGGEVCYVPASINKHLDIPKSAKIIYAKDNVYRYAYPQQIYYSAEEFLPDSIIAINYSYKNYLLALPRTFKGTLKLEKKLRDLEKAFDSPEVQEILYSTIW